MAEIKIIRKGAFTTVQDAGRIGHQNEGVRPSGACDMFSMRIANALLGNADGAAVLEFTFFGAVLGFSHECSAAFTGADMPVTVNGTPVPRNGVFTIPAGGIVEIGTAASGLRGYLAVAGGILTPEKMGSRSSERPLGDGDMLPYGPMLCAAGSRDIDALRAVRSRVRLSESGSVCVLRFVPGPQEERFSVGDFSRNIYTVGPDSDRMGVRLNGAKLDSECGYDVLSDGIAPGAIQISGNGLPVVMLAAHQTTGGYAKIGTVITADLKHMAQMRPGESVCFSPVTPDEARDYLIHEEKIIADAANGG